MTFRHISSPISLILAAAGLAVTVVGYVLIPAEALLPVHWGLDGKVDSTMPRNIALLLPVGFALVVWLVFYAVDRFAPALRAEGARHALRATLMAITGLFVAIQVGVVAIGLGVEVDMVRIVTVAVALLLFVLGNVLPKTQPNSFAGIRIPSTMRDPANWQATHRFTGWLMMGAGVLLLVVTPFLPTGTLIVTVLAAAVLPLAIGAIYSLRLARRSRSA